MKRIFAALAILGILITAGCTSKADRVSDNLSAAADNFEIQRRIVFINGITDKYLMVIEGRCSLGNSDQPGELSVTCKIGPDAYKKHFLGLSDNVTYFVEQLEVADADEYRYRVFFRPESLLPDIDR